MKQHENVLLSDYVGYGPQEMAERADAFLAEIKRRHSVRDFSDRSVPRAIIDACILAAGSAPSGANHQPWHFAVISSPDAKRRVRIAAEAEETSFYNDRAPQDWLDALAPLGTNASKPFLETAPYLIAIFAQKRGGIEAGDDRKNYYINESVGIATGFLIAALHHAGLCTLTHTPNPMKFLNHTCGRPSTEKPFLLLVVGYPAENATVPVHALSKKALSDISSSH